MKKTFTVSILAIFALILTACGSSNSASGQSFNPSGQNSGNTSAPLPLSSELLIGTLKLDGTPQEVTAEQAAQLLPLWQLLKTLDSSSTAASQEVDATVQQIKSTMTAAQITAIDNMNITRREEFTTMQDLGLVQVNASGTPQPGSNRPQGGFGGGGFGNGGGPGGFTGGQGGNRSFSPEQIATAQAARSQGTSINRVPSALLDALIKYLETKANS